MRVNNMTSEEVTMYSIKCECGEYSESRDDFGEAVSIAEYNGWERVGDEYICYQCAGNKK